jgi:hypothetical protein
MSLFADFPSDQLGSRSRMRESDSTELGCWCWVVRIYGTGGVGEDGTGELRCEELRRCGIWGGACPRSRFVVHRNPAAR